MVTIHVKSAKVTWVAESALFLYWIKKLLKYFTTITTISVISDYMLMFDDILAVGSKSNSSSKAVYYLCHGYM
jgi:hypothetical protein